MVNPIGGWKSDLDRLREPFSRVRELMARFEFGALELHEHAAVAGGADALFELGLM